MTVHFPASLSEYTAFLRRLLPNLTEFLYPVCNEGLKLFVIAPV